MILIPFTYCQIQLIAPHVPLAVRSVFALKKTLVFVPNPGFGNGKQTRLPGPSHKQPFAKIADFIFKPQFPTENPPFNSILQLI